MKMNWKMMLAAAAFAGTALHAPARADEPTTEAAAQAQVAEGLEMSAVSDSDLSMIVNDGEATTEALEANEAPAAAPNAAPTAEAPAPTNGESHRHGPRPLPEACQKANVTEEQKGQIKAAFQAARREKVELKAQAQLARLDYAALISNPNATAQGASDAGNKVVETVSKLIAAKTALKTNILFNILKADQREPAVKCAKILKHRHHGRHHGRGHGEGRWSHGGGAMLSHQ
jgi:Spy/CpxP family protein refolding chaperone